jgi:hypothetical protein
MMPYQAVDSALTDTIAMAQRFIPAGQPDSVQIVNAFFWNSGATQRTIDYQMHVGGRWMLMRVAEYEDVHGTRYIAGFSVTPLSASLQSINAFTLHNASPGALIALMLALVAILVSLYAAVQVVRSPLERKWLWVVVALLGFGKIGVAWHTGQIQQQWIAVQLLGAGIQRDGPYGPWWIYFSVPGGAIVALDRRRRAIAKLAQPTPVADTDETVSPA